MLRFREPDDKAIQSISQIDLAAEARVAAQFIDRVEHFLFVAVARAHTLRPIRIDIDMAGGAGAIAAAISIDTRYSIVSRRPHQCRANGNIDGTYRTGEGDKGNFGHAIPYLIIWDQVSHLSGLQFEMGEMSNGSILLSAVVLSIRVASSVILAILATANLRAAEAAVAQKKIDDLKPTKIIHLGKTADWVATTTDAVWVGSTGPFAVHKIDAKTNIKIATVKLNGSPCAGLAVGFGSLWIPLCGKINTLARVDLESNKLLQVFNIGPAAAEGGIAASSDSIWLVINKQGSLARIDPDTGRIRQIVRVPSGSYNAVYADHKIWVTHAGGAELTGVDEATGVILAKIPTGAGPRFLTAGAGAVWTLNQGDGSLTRVELDAPHSAATIALNTPGKGGDISFGSDMIWTTVSKVPLSMIDAGSTTLLCQWTGKGGDSLAVGHGAIWLTDYHAGTVSRIELDQAVANCKDRPR
jgi:virginiamycin B lyase